MEGLEQAANTGEVAPTNMAPQGGSPNAPGSTVPADANQPVDDSDEKLADADATGAKVDEADAVIKTASDNSAALSNIADQMQASVATGGMDDANTKALRVATEHFYRSLNFKQSSVKKRSYSQEDFKDKDSRIKATLEEASNIRENVKAILAKIVEALKKGFEMAAKYFGQLLDGANSLKNKADKLNGDANNLKGKALDSATRIPFGNHYALLSVGGRYVTGDALINAFGTYQHSKIVQVDWFRAWDVIKPDLDEAIKEAPNSENQVKLVKDFSDKLLNKVVRTMGEIGGKGIASGTLHTTTTDLMFGTAEFVQQVDSTDPSTYVGRIEAANTKVVVPANLAPMNPDQIVRLTRLVSDHLNKYKDIPNTLTQFINSVRSFFSDVSNDAQLQGEQLEMLKKWMIYAKKVTYGNGCVMRRYDLRVCKALLDYSKASIDAINGKTTESGNTKPT